MGTEKKIEALKEAAERKRQDALNRTNEAINQLIKQGKRISFPTVAEAAGVSVTYLYKYDDLRNRIEHLRKQQNQAINKSTLPQAASEKSKNNIVYNLKQEINKLRIENRSLRDQIEMVYGRLHSLKLIEPQVASLRTENSILSAEINSLKQQLNECSLTLTPNATVTTLDQKREKRTDISKQVKLKLAEVEIDLNTTLTKMIKSATDDYVLSAIEAYKQARAVGEIGNPGGWLNRAIKSGWKPSEKHLPQDKLDRDIFNEWYNLAKKQGLIMASTKGDDGKLYVFSPDGERFSFEMMLIKHPLEKLKASLLKA